MNIRGILALGLAAGFLGGASAANATTVCFGGDLGPSTCSPEPESQVFLQAASDVTTGFGNVGSQDGTPVVQFTSGDSLDFANGYATIKPSTHGHHSAFYSLDITIPGRVFTDLIFDLKMLQVRGGESFTISAYDGATLAGSYTYTAADGLTHDHLTTFIVAAHGGTLTEIDLSTTTGFTQAKHFQVSGDPVPGVPEASTWGMMLVGFAGLGFAGYRARRTRVALGA